MPPTLPPFVLTFDDGDHCLLALRLPTEDEQNAALLEITRMKREREANKREFHNTLRILCGIDYREVSWMTPGQWVRFREHPYHFVIQCSDADYDRIWAVIDGRQSAAAMRAEARSLDDFKHAEYLRQKAEML